MTTMLTILPIPTRYTTPSKDRCRIHDGDVSGCDATPGCAYYLCSESCWPRGTTNSTSCPSSQKPSSGYSYDFPDFFWGAALGGALVFGGVLAAVLMKFLFASHPKNLLKGYVDATYGAIQGKSVPLYDALLGVGTNAVFTIAGVDLLNLALSAIMGVSVELPRIANVLAWRVPLLLAVPFVYLYLWKRYMVTGTIEERRTDKRVREAIRTYLVLTIAITTSVMLFFGAKLFYLFLLWGFGSPGFDPVSTTRPFSYLFVTLPIAGIHMMLLRKLKRGSREGPRERDS